MDTVTAEVIEILSKPYFFMGRWIVNAIAVDELGQTTVSIMFDSEQKAAELEVGYKFDHCWE